MSNHLRLYPRPLALTTGFATVPTLSISGALPNYISGAAYEGRLPFTGNVGDVSVEWLTGELPVGAYITVDNTTNDVVVAWPAYEEFSTLDNAAFLSGAAGWELGAGWEVGATGGAETGGVAASYTGKGYSLITHAAYTPAEPGQVITARARINPGQNGNGSEGHVVLLWYGVGRTFIDSDISPLGVFEDVYEWDSTTGTAPEGTTFARLAVIGYHRHSKSPLYVDRVEWDNTTSIGTNGTDTYCITLRIRDGLGREADWAGCIEEGEVAPLSISGNLPWSAVGESVSYQYEVTGGVEPRTCTISAGSLPPGLTMDTNGLVTGSRTLAGTYTWTVTVADAASSTDSVTNTVYKYWNTSGDLGTGESFATGGQDVIRVQSFFSPLVLGGAPRGTGRYYFEIELLSQPVLPSGQTNSVGVLGRDDAGLSDSITFGWDGDSSTISSPLAFFNLVVAVGDRIGFAVDMDTGELSPFVNGESPDATRYYGPAPPYPIATVGGAKPMIPAPNASDASFRLHQYADDLLYLPATFEAWAGALGTP